MSLVDSNATVDDCYETFSDAVQALVTWTCPHFINFGLHIYYNTIYLFIIPFHSPLFNMSVSISTQSYGSSSYSDPLQLLLPNDHTEKC